VCQDVVVTEVVRPWRGVSAEDRRAERRAQLVEACFDVVGASGLDAVTVDVIAKQAGLSKRYFYESFADRQDVVAATYDELMNRVRARLVAVVSDKASGEERIRAMVAELARALVEDPRGARLYMEASRSTAAEDRRHHSFDEFGAIVATNLFTHPDDPRVVATALLIVAGTTEVLASWLGGRLALSEAEVVDLIVGIGLGARNAVG
jgi:AcrR family transcriptional regulator